MIPQRRGGARSGGKLRILSLGNGAQVDTINGDDFVECYPLMEEEDRISKMVRKLASMDTTINGLPQMDDVRCDLDKKKKLTLHLKHHFGKVNIQHQGEPSTGPSKTPRNSNFDLTLPGTPRTARLT